MISAMDGAIDDKIKKNRSETFRLKTYFIEQKV